MTAALGIVGPLVLLPGVGLALAAAPPGKLRPETRLALAFGGGYAVVLAVATLLAVGRVLGTLSFVAGVILATGALWALVLARDGLRPHVRALVLQVREAPVYFGSAAAAVTVFGVTRLGATAHASLVNAGPWRYWSDGLEVAAAGRIPETTRQWGSEYPATISKMGLSSFEAGVSYLTGPAPLAPMAAILVVAALGLFLSLWALGAELQLGPAAPVVPLAVILVPSWLPAAHEITNDLQLYRAEDIGRMAAFCAAATTVAAMRSEAGKLLTVVAGTVLAAASLTHLVPVMVSLALLVWWLALWVISHRRGARRAVLVFAAVVAVAGGLWIVTTSAAGRTLGFEGTSESTGGAGIPAGIDATRSFRAARYRDEVQRSGHFLYPPRTVIDRFLTTTSGDAGGSPGQGALLLALLAGGSVLVILRFRRRFSEPIVIAWGLMGTFLTVALGFSLIYATQVPGDFGMRRLFDYVALTLALLAAAVLAGAAAALAGRVPRSQAAAAVVLCAAAAVGALLVPAARGSGYAPRSLRALDVIARVVPCDARLMPNARTAGSFEALLGRGTLLEGMAPYLRPSMMSEVLPRLVDGRAFFADPRANVDYLDRERVQFVAVMRNVAVGSAGGDLFPADERALAALPGMREVARKANVTVYAYGGAEPKAPAAAPPGRCALTG